MGFIFNIAQYYLGRWCLLKYWDTIPMLNNVDSLKEFRGFTIIQAFSDVLHVIAISLQYLMSGEVHESILCYMITDLLFHTDVFRKNWIYLVHHILSVTLIFLAIQFDISKDTINFTSFYFEVGLLPIAIMDFMSAYGLFIPTYFFLIRPIMYFCSRAYIVYHIYDNDLFFVLMPLMFHNAYVLYLQIRSVLKHALIWKFQQTLKILSTEAHLFVNR